MLTNRRDLFVAGDFVTAHATKTSPLVNPATETPIGSVVEADETDIDHAVRAAREALPAWRETSIADRGAYLDALAETFDKRKDAIAGLVTRENGSTISRSKSSNGTLPLAVYRSYARRSGSFEDETWLVSGSDQSIIRHEPVGVVAAIVPWNAPQVLLSKKLAPALLAGCTLVVKPSPETSLDAYVVAEIVKEIGLPEGVVNVVTGGRETGASLVAHPGVDKVSFTGSTRAGRWVAETCGRMLKSVTAELGGKSAAIVLDDADLDLLRKNLISICLPNTGQVCYASTRVLAPRHRFDEVVDAVVTTLEAARIGDPTDPGVDFGPLVSATQRDRVEGYIRSGVDDGARILVGGGRVAQQPVGYYIEPTVFVDVKPDMAIFREEIFGPVLVVVPYDDDDDAVRVANDSTYGLAGSVFGGDVDRATAIARRIEAGNIQINGYRGAPGASPHGYKDSGVGGDPGLAAYLQQKTISQPPESTSPQPGERDGRPRATQ